MAVHIIGIGGTGHRIINSILTIAAAGVFENDRINILTIDSDGGNGDFTSLKDTLKHYQEYQKITHSAKVPLNVPQIIIPGEGGVNWSPLDSNQKLADYVNKNKLSQDMQDLLDFLYTDAEQNTELKEGFYGHPSIGSYIIQNELQKSDKWESFTDEINDNEYVFIVGSVYGGTGASGIPVITSLLGKLQKQPKIVTLLSMPYFTPIETREDKAKKEGKDGNDFKLRPDRACFIPKTKGALYYYHQQKYADNVSALYIIGEKIDNFAQEKYSAGGVNQKHKAHITEFFSVTALIHFMEAIKQKEEFSVYIAQREKVTVDDVSTLPYTWDMVKLANPAIVKKFKLFTMMAIMYTKIFYYELTTAKTTAKKIQNNLVKNSDAQNLYRCMLTYCEWLKGMHIQNSFSDGKFTQIPYSLVRLFDFNGRENLCNGIYSGVSLDGFKNVIFGSSLPDTEVIYGDIIKRLDDKCNMSNFIKCLYEACSFYLTKGEK